VHCRRQLEMNNGTRVTVLQLGERRKVYTASNLLICRSLEAGLFVINEIYGFRVSANWHYNSH